MRHKCFNDIKKLIFIDNEMDRQKIGAFQYYCQKSIKGD